LHAKIQADIPTGWKLYGENMFAKHSIHYKNLSTYFFLFAILDNTNCFISWDETTAWANLFGLQTVPQLYRGLWDDRKIRSIWKGVSSFGGDGEGYVIRNSGNILYKNFSDNYGKYVRPAHVNTSVHWMKEEIIPNLLNESADMWA